MIHGLIIKGNHNHKPPMNKNDWGRGDGQKSATVYNKGFQMPPLSPSSHIGEIYTIRLQLSNWTILDHILSIRASSTSRH